MEYVTNNIAITFGSQRSLGACFGSGLTVRCFLNQQIYIINRCLEKLKTTCCRTFMHLHILERCIA